MSSYVKMKDISVNTSLEATFFDSNGRATINKLKSQENWWI